MLLKILAKIRNIDNGKIHVRNEGIYKTWSSDALLTTNLSWILKLGKFGVASSSVTKLDSVALTYAEPWRDMDWAAYVKPQLSIPMPPASRQKRLVRYIPNVIKLLDVPCWKWLPSPEKIFYLQMITLHFHSTAMSHTVVPTYLTLQQHHQE